MRGAYIYPGANWTVGSRRRERPKDTAGPSSIFPEHVRIKQLTEKEAEKKALLERQALVLKKAKERELQQKEKERQERISRRDQEKQEQAKRKSVRKKLGKWPDE
jgi:hypothetical protein